MEIEQIVNLKGPKILDTNTFHPIGSNLLKVLYNCHSSSHLNSNIVQEEIEALRKAQGFLSRTDTFTISETGQELKKFLTLLNGQFSFHSDQRSHQTDFFKRKAKRKGNSRKQYREHKTQEELTKVNEIGTLAKDSLNLIKRIKRKDIRDIFTPEERADYKILLRYFLEIAERYDLHICYQREDEKLYNKNQCEFQTDEKLLAAALAIESDISVSLICSDSDVKRMLRHFRNGIDCPFEVHPFRRRNLYLYSNYRKSREYELQII